jgi:hypothetical protein
MAPSVEIVCSIALQVPGKQKTMHFKDIALAKYLFTPRMQQMTMMRKVNRSAILPIGFMLMRDWK